MVSNFYQLLSQRIEDISFDLYGDEKPVLAPICVWK